MSERPVRSEEYLSDFETMLWTLERDPQLASGFANITFLDRPADVDRMRVRLLRAAALIPQLRRRVFSDPAHLTSPRWVDDPDFDITHHVRTYRLDPPGDVEQLIDVAMAFCHREYDPDHPLWEFLVVDGLDDGRGAMLQRFHHTISDGIGMVRISEQFIDLERDAPEPDLVHFPEPVPLPSAVGASREALGHTIQRGVHTLRQGLVTTGELLTDSQRLLGGARRSLDVARALITETTSAGSRHSPLWNDRSPDRTLRLLRVPFERVREASRAQGVTINDVFVAGAAGGAGAYHRAKGSPVESLRMAMPVSTRIDRTAAGNAFGMARITVPTDAEAPGYLDAIHKVLAKVRGGAELALPQLLAGAANLLPPALLVQITRAQVSSVDFTTSNVRGAPFPIFMGGALVTSNHPIGPLVGTACNLTTLSYNGSLDMGLHIDRGAIDDPDLLATCIETTFSRLLAG